MAFLDPNDESLKILGQLLAPNIQFLTMVVLKILDSAMVQKLFIENC